MKVFFLHGQKKCITQQQFWALGVLLLFLFPIIWHAKIKAVWPFFWRGHVAFREDNLQTTTRSPLTLVLHCGLLPILYLAEAKRESMAPGWPSFFFYMTDIFSKSNNKLETTWDPWEKSQEYWLTLTHWIFGTHIWRERERERGGQIV